MDETHTSASNTTRSGDRGGSRKKEPGIGQTLLDDLRSGDLRRSLREDLRETYRFYLDDARRDELSAMGQAKRWLVATWWLLKSMFFKLTPARRLFLVLSLYFVVNGSLRDPTQIVVGFVVLFFILLLELKDKLLAQDELAAGRAVQLALMPDRNPRVSGWETWLFTRPANDVGGDLVDYLERPDGLLGLALGDIAGKGLPAALLMARLQATLRALAPEAPSLANLGTTLNDIFYRDGLRSRFASLVYLEVTPETDAVRLLNAGHLPPLIVRADGTVEEAPRGGPALGLMPGVRFTEQHLDLAPGDLLVVYSDGVTEARNAYGWFFEEDRLHAILPQLPGRTAEDAGRRILSAVEHFIGDARPHDDLSLVVLRRCPEGAPSPDDLLIAPASSRRSPPPGAGHA
ncbi:MAG: hypothetical protein KatS3mg043_2115 [Rhodothermaceae bacterium]|nr:MAG: hypothetical protein KatS3mg043_2115 [Rhodothermaceae bacterium]